MSKPTEKQILDALTGNSMDGCDPDWCRSILENADSGDITRVEETINQHTENEAETIIARRTFR